MTDHIDLIARAEAALDGVTDGPWDVFIYDAGGKWTGWPISVSAVKFIDKNIVRPGGCWPYEWDASTSQTEAVANARFIAASRQLVPELLAALKAAQAERDAAMKGGEG